METLIYPLISVRLLADIEKRGRIAVQDEFGMNDTAFCDVIKFHAFAVYCFHHPNFAASINYVQAFPGGTKTEW